MKRFFLYSTLFIISSLVALFCYTSYYYDFGKMYVINLDRSTNRLEHIQKQFSKAGLIVDRFAAIDGNKLKILAFGKNNNDITELSGQELNKLKYKEDPRRDHFQSYRILCSNNEEENFNLAGNLLLTGGEAGCTCSHYLLWHKMLTENRSYITVIEDDVLLTQKLFKIKLFLTLATAPKNWDIIFLHPQNRVAQKRLRFSFTNKLKNDQFWGTLGYIISQTGARKLVEYTKYTTLPIDSEIAKIVRDKKLSAYTMKFPIVFEDKEEGSLIIEMGRRALIGTDSTTGAPIFRPAQPEK